MVRSGRPAPGAALGNVDPVGSDLAPWGFEGEAILVWGRAGSRPLFLAALHHTRSPDGPFVELVAGALKLEPSVRPGLRWTTLAVGAPAGGEAATLKWWAGGRLREVRWEERGLRLRAKVGRRGIPAPGRVPLLRLEAPARLIPTRVEVEVPGGDALAALAGRRRGLLVSTARSALDEPWLLLPRAVRIPPMADPA